MSSQSGNVSRSRPQKYKNRTAFKNNLHDTSHTTKFINTIQVSDVCQRCKEIIEWKIKYKKYKPLSQPGKCVKCEQRTVKKAYHMMCSACGRSLKVCTKCGQSKEIVATVPDQEEQIKLDQEMKDLLQSLPERKRRTFMRYMDKKSKEETTEENTKDVQKKDLVEKLNALKVDTGEDDDLDFTDSDGGGGDSGDDEN